MDVPVMLVFAWRQPFVTSRVARSTPPSRCRVWASHLTIGVRIRATRTGCFFGGGGRRWLVIECLRGPS